MHRNYYRPVEELVIRKEQKKENYPVFAGWRRVVSLEKPQSLEKEKKKVRC